MKIEVIKEFRTDELKERLEEEQKQLTKMRLNHAVSALENPTKIREYKQAIARMKTELRKREIDKAKS